MVDDLKLYIIKVIESYPGKTRHFIVTTLNHWYILGKCPRFYDPDAYAAMDELLQASVIRAEPPRPGGRPYMYFVNREVVQHA